MRIGHRKEIRKLTFRALALRRSEGHRSHNLFIRKFWILSILNAHRSGSFPSHNIKKSKFRVVSSPSLKLNRILYFCTISKEEVRIIDITVLHENYTTLIKHFVSRDTTGQAKVSRIYCRSRLGLPVLALCKGTTYVGYNDAEDISVKHSSVQTILRNKTTTP